MHIKRYESRDMADALRRIRRDLGPDALILDSRNTGAGRVEVLAAIPHPAPDPVEDEVTASPAVELTGEDLWKALRRQARRAARAAEGVPAESRVETRGWPEAGTPVAESRSRTQDSGDRSSPSHLETRDRRPSGVPLEPSHVETRPQRTPAPRNDSLDARQSEALLDRLDYLGRLVRSDHFSTLSEPLRDLYLDLVEADLDGNLVFELLSRFQHAAENTDDRSVRAALLERLRKLVTVGGTLQKGSTGRVLALVGPTGVGKTTTVAKIAGHAAYVLGLRISLLSLDGYRIFGADHLRTYAELMGLPFEAITEADQLRPALRELRRHSDVVIVDTSGRSPRDASGIEELRRLLAADPELEIHLVLAANGRVRDLVWALERFSALPVRHLVFTKVDETRSAAGLFTLALKAGRPVSYLGTGQEVPDDLEEASASRLSEELTRTVSNRAPEARRWRFGEGAHA